MESKRPKSKKERALAGFRVLDFSQVMAGPFLTMLLGDLGADIVKVESPIGDSSRRMSGARGGKSPAFDALNRNKRSVVLDLKDPLGQKAARRLALRADVLVENFRPGVMAGFGLDYDALQEKNPGLVYASISGFGQTGPYAERGGFDLIAQGMSGIMSVTGEAGQAPIKCGIPVTDLGAGLLALYGILAALVHRGRTGQGQRVDTSLLEAGVALSVWESAQFLSGNGVPGPMGSAHRMVGPYQAIHCNDGYLNIGAANDRTWEKLARVLGHPEWCQDLRFKTATDRVANRKELEALIELETRSHSRAYWLKRFDEDGIPAGPILQYDEVFDEPHLQAREMIWEYRQPDGGTGRAVGNPVKLSASPAYFHRSPPTLGEHTREVLAELGFNLEEIDALSRWGGADRHVS